MTPQEAAAKIQKTMLDVVECDALDKLIEFMPLFSDWVPSCPENFGDWDAVQNLMDHVLGPLALLRWHVNDLQEKLGEVYKTIHR